MEEMRHWTQQSVPNFAYSIASHFVSQIETRMEEEHVSRSELAERLNKTSGRVSQVLNNPGNLSLRLIVDYARVLGMKVGIVAYDDGDPGNDRGPIIPEVFVRSWEKLNRPADLFQVEETNSTLLSGLLWDRIKGYRLIDQTQTPETISILKQEVA